MKVLIASPVDADAVARLRLRHEVIDAVGVTADELRRRCADCEILVFRSGVRIDAALIEAAPCLRLLIRAGSGLDNVDCTKLRERGLPLVRIAEPGARAVAELAFGLMLVLARQILAADRLMRGGNWAKHQLHGALLQGKTLGVVGVGNIGTVAAQLGNAWGMEVFGCVRRPSAARRVEHAALGTSLVDFDEVLARADYLALFVPLTTETRNLIDAAALGKMKTGSLLINLARGEVVDEAVLLRALQTPGGIAGAALDVHHQEGENLISPLAELPNVVLTPHIGAMTVDTQREIGRRIIAHVEQCAAGTAPSAP